LRRVPVVGREGDLGAELSAASLRHVAPQHLQPLETRRLLADGQSGARESQA
jgi:hypothetical protein